MLDLQKYCYEKSEVKILSGPLLSSTKVILLLGSSEQLNLVQ
jgi:hypothetical protein